MVKPSQPKGIKPKAEITEGAAPSMPESSPLELTGTKLILVNILITIIIGVLFIVGNYFTINGIISSKLKNMPTMASHGGEEGGNAHGGNNVKKGIILDLGEFILNLSDPSAKRYLKVNVALELSRASHDPDLHAEASGGGHGAAPVDPIEIIEKEMSQYKPAIRDSIISVLSSKTAEELASLAGKELSKEQIKEAIDPIFAGEREVMRVSFGAFIIQ